MRKTTELKRLHMPQYWVEGRSTGSLGGFTATQAAVFMGVTVGSLRARVSANRAFSKFIEDSDFAKNPRQADLYTCSKMAPDELSAQLEIFNKTVKQHDLQSPVPAPQSDGG